MRPKKKPTIRKPAVAPETVTRRSRNSWEPQVIVPQQVDLPLERQTRDEVVVPAAPNGRSLANGRL